MNSLLRLEAVGLDSWRWRELDTTTPCTFKSSFRKIIGTRQSQDEEGGHDVHVHVEVLSKVVV